MADTPNSSEVAALQASLDAAMQATDNLNSALGGMDGNAQKAAASISKIYGAMAQQLNAQIKQVEKINKLAEERRKLEEDLADANKKNDKDAQALLKKKLADKQVDLLTEQQILDTQKNQVKNQQEYLAQLGKTQGVLKQILSSELTGMVAKLGSLKSIQDGYKSLFNAVSKVANISIAEGSYLGMSGSYLKDLKDLGVATLAYSYQSAQAVASAEGLGHSQEEASAAFQRFARIAKGSGMSERSAEMKDLTVAASQLSVVLGTGLGETTEYMVQAQTKFGRTGGQTADALNHIYLATKKANQEFGAGTVVGRDVTKVLFDLGSESNSLAQDQRVLADMLVGNLVQLQAQGLGYDKALATSADYIKKLTTQAPDWAKIMGGKNLMKSLGDSFEQINPQILANLEQAKPGISAKLKEVYATKMDTFSRQQVIQAMLQDTQVGMDAMQDSMLKVINVNGQGALQRIMAIYHTTDPLQAQAYLTLAKNRQKEQDFYKLSATEAQKLYGVSQKDFELLKQKGNEGVLHAVLQKKATKEADDAQKAQIAKNETDRVNNLKAAKEKLEAFKKEQALSGGAETEPQKAIREQLEVDVKGFEKDSIAAITDPLSKDMAAFKTATGAYFKQFASFMKSDLMQIATGFGSFLLMYNEGRKQTNLLRSINANIAGGRPGGSGDVEKTILEHSGGIFKEAWKGIREGQGFKGRIAGAAKGALSGGKDAFKGILKDTLGIGAGKAAQATTDKALAQMGEIAAGKAAAATEKRALGGLFKGVGGKLLGGGIGAVAGLGLDAFMNRDQIGGAFQKGGLRAGLGETFKDTIGSKGLASSLLSTALGAAGGFAGSVVPVAGNIAGAAVGGMAGDWIGSIIDKALGTESISKLLGFPETPMETGAAGPSQAALGMPGAVSGGGGASGEPQVINAKLVPSSQGTSLQFLFKMDTAAAQAQNSSLAMAKSAW